MALKCLVLGIETLSPVPSYKEIDALSPKGGGVLYGGGKRKNKTISYYERLETLTGSVSSLIRKFDKRDGNYRYYELYLLAEKAALPFLLLKYQEEYAGSFMLDGSIIDKLNHIDWCLSHIEGEISSLSDVSFNFDFYKSKNISDRELELAFPAYEKSVEKFLEKLHLRKKSLLEEAKLIIKAGWN